jgi:hypothetical protein
LPKFGDERAHQAAVPVALLEEPFTFQGLSRNPVKQVRIHLRTDRLHEIAGKAVACLCIDVQNP